MASGGTPFIGRFYYLEISGGTNAPIGQDLPFTVEMTPALKTTSTLSMSVGANGALNILVTGSPDRAYRLESSTDLNNWVTRSMDSSPDGVIHYNLPGGNQPTTQFFRAGLQP